MKIGRRLWLGCTLVACFVIVLQLSALHKSAAAAVTVSPWLSTAPPTLDKLRDLGPNDLTYSNTHNQSCQEREIITIPKRTLPLPQAKKSQAGCVVDTKFGALSINGLLQRQGSTVAGVVRNINGLSTQLVPIPGSNTVINLFGGLFTGYYVQFFDSLDTSLTSSAIYSGEVTHKLPLPAGSLKDKAGNLLVVAHESISFSANGDWMVADLPWVGTARINTKTRDVLPFGDKSNYTNGVGPGFSTAISPDGRYAVMASSSPGRLLLYDLSTCAAVPSTITKKVSCASQDLLLFTQQHVPGFSHVSSVRFRSNYTLDMYLGSNIGTTTKLTRYILTADGQQTTGYQYLALGDSFASGEGAYQYKAITDTTENKCHLSQRSYPYLISSVLGFGQYESVACSGAKIEDLLREDRGYKGQVKDGKTREDRNLSEILSGMDPGYIGQNDFIKNYQPVAITISAAGNDIAFADKIIRCIDTDTCYNSYEDRLEIANEVNSQFYRLTGMYDQLKNAGDPRAKIYVIGYPQITYPDGNCAVNVHLNQQELIFANQLVSYLNSMVKAAAANAGVAYIDVEDALSGHRLCETDSWNVAVNGLTAGNDIVNLPFIHGPVGNESFHPNALAQELLKAKILQQTGNFTLAMPTPNPTASITDPSNDLDFLQVPKSNRTVRIIQNKTGTNGGVIKLGETWVTQYSSLAPLIKAGSTVHGWLNSTPVDLGTFTTDASGNLTVQITLPSSVPPGFHTLHLYGKNTSDEDVDLYETVYVTSHTGQTCMVVPASDQDSDNDEIDDACDPLIGPPPLVVEPDPAPETQIGVIPPPETPPNNPPMEVIVDEPPDLPPANETPPLEITEEDTPSLATESPQATVMPQNTEQPNHKPPENNPETVAGNEHQTTETPQTQPLQIAASTTPNLNNPQATPQIQGVNTVANTQDVGLAEDSIPASPPTLFKTKETPWLNALYALLSLATLLALIKVIRHPK